MSCRTKRQLKLVGIVVAFFLGMNLTLLKRVFQHKETVSINQHHHSDSTPTVLIWYPPFGSKNEYRADSKTCGDGIHCMVTYDRSRLEDSEAVVFHFKSIAKKTMPNKRRKDQLYVWWSEEKNGGRNFEEFDNYFNLTFTYRRDSGIYAPYGSTNIILEDLGKRKGYDLEELLRRKRKSRKLAAWAVSNCSVNRRMQLARDLISSGLDLDTYGACFENRELGNGPNTESFYDALAEYKFYLAFENGYHCTDYITEKFWYNGLRAGAVPVVWGPRKADVEAVAPKNSFIHVEDFKSTDDLVGYLFHLSVNEKEYKKYLSWRSWVSNPEKKEKRFVGNKELHSFCKLCQMLLDRRKQPKESRSVLTVPSLHQWLRKGEDKECMQSDFFDKPMPQDGVRRFLKARGLDLF